MRKRRFAIRPLDSAKFGFIGLRVAKSNNARPVIPLTDRVAEMLRARFKETTCERIRAGLAHARQNDKRLGWPVTAARHADQVRKLRRSGLSKSQIARQLNIGHTSVRRILDSKAQA